jgi:hypothetical protein
MRNGGGNYMMQKRWYGWVVVDHDEQMKKYKLVSSGK